MANYWSLNKDFRKGDTVQRIAHCGLSPFMGRVLKANTSVAIVRFPYGLERVPLDKLAKVTPGLMSWFPSTLVPRGTKVASESQWRSTQVPAGFHQDLALNWSKQASDLFTYDALWRKYSTQVSDSVLRDEILKFYRFARNLFDLRLQQHMAKSATYWAAANRQYRVTSEEHESRKPGCPKCGTSMRKTTYKMAEGNRVRLFACPKDLFLVRQADLLGPDGVPLEW